jgi:nucleoid DNA-binding protein
MLENEFINADRIKRVLITKAAIKTLKSEQVVDKVITFQFRELLEATRKYNSVELSWFGKFILSPKKLAKRIVMMQQIINKMNRLLEDPELSEKKKATILVRLEGVKNDLNNLKTRENEYRLGRDSGGA